MKYNEIKCYVIEWWFQLLRQRDDHDAKWSYK